MPAQAWMREELSPRAVLQVGGGVALPGAPVAWIAPGAGLEFRAFVPGPGAGGGFEIDCAGAAAAPLHAHEPDEAAVLAALGRQVGRVCAADVLSAEGLVLSLIHI